ncbi:hypothetical protein B0H63DRAFT_83587 [Podospora didyma]|uniref:C2H2-type domain-containing protein n=1 Tax=Podospora didyma TaxID=330526 RepID=A0AAE0K007_9PEZI|nr:hypothetical protein B0H63DRAFT_83587 [Podospora didyma]
MIMIANSSNSNSAMFSVDPTLLGLEDQTNLQEEETDFTQAVSQFSADTYVTYSPNLNGDGSSTPEHQLHHLNGPSQSAAKNNWTGQSTALLTCPYPNCQATAKYRRDMIRHTDAVHKKAEAFFCHYSGCTRKKGFPRKDQLVRHEKTVHWQSFAQQDPRLEERSTSPNASQRATPGSWEYFGGLASDSDSQTALTLQVHEERERRLEVERELKEVQRRLEEKDKIIDGFLTGRVVLSWKTAA